MEFREYKGKKLIALLRYNEDYGKIDGTPNKQVYVEPLLLVNGSTYERIDSADFPKYGEIAIKLSNGEYAEAVCDEFGPIVKVQINKDDVYANEERPCEYLLQFDRTSGRGRSPVWIEQISGQDFYQVYDIDGNIEALQKAKQISLVELGRTPITNRILLQYNGKLYGPFNTDSKGEQISLLGMPEHDYQVGEYTAKSFSPNIFAFENSHKKEMVAKLLPSNLLPSPESCEKRYDWVTNERLIKAFISTLKVSSTHTKTKAELREIENTVLDLMRAHSELSITDERAARIQNWINDVKSEDLQLQDIVLYALANDASKDILVQEIIDKHFEEIRDSLPEFESYQDEIQKLHTEIDILASQKEQMEGVISARDTAEVNELKQKVNDLENEKEEIEEKLKLQDSIDVLQDNIEILRQEESEYKKKRDDEKRRYEEAIANKTRIESELNARVREFADTGIVAAKALDSKLLERILRSVSGEPEEDTTSYFAQLTTHAPMSSNEIIDRIFQYIHDNASRNVSRNDVINYLICLSQGFITTFAGDPGTGKTSLCNIIAKALGLTVDGQQGRFIDISVERGWTSHKDFIGYYNPLTKTMEKSNSQVFDALKMLNNEDPIDVDVPFLILLDEANLSPIEHYWAAFLKACDFDSSENRSISLGGNENWKIPDCLRFLATVNFDHTTEELSPRFLDRSWIITLEPTNVDEDADIVLPSMPDAISFKSLMEAFSPKGDAKIDELISNKWDAIQAIFRDMNMSIMPRNLKMVHRYLTVACGCMDMDTPTSKMAPLDYAFSQKVLPTINGTGEKYHELIDRLLDVCTDQSMPISAKHLKRIKQAAEENMGFYQFFAH